VFDAHLPQKSTFSRVDACLNEQALAGDWSESQSMVRPGMTCVSCITTWGRFEWQVETRTLSKVKGCLTSHKGISAKFQGTGSEPIAVISCQATSETSNHNLEL